MNQTAVEAEASRAGWVSRALVLLLRGYQKWISPLFPPSCRFYPSCSAYAIEAMTEHGALRGSWLAARRLLRCGPWHPGGVDPVPPPRRERGEQAVEGQDVHRDRVQQTTGEE